VNTGETDRFQEVTDLLSVSRHSVLVRVNGNGMHCQLMGSPEHTYRDFLSGRGGIPR